jgi:hypothetical protein
MVQLNLAYLKSRPAFSSDDVRKSIYDQVTEIAGPLSTRSISGFPAFPAVKLNDQSVRKGLVTILRNIAGAK